MKTSKCWVWFKGSLNEGGSWKEGFSCTFDEKPGILIESPSYVSCRVPNWRVSTKEPEDLTKAPLIPDNAIWKLFKLNFLQKSTKHNSKRVKIIKNN